MCMIKEKSNCFDLRNPKQKKHYEKWKKLIRNLTDEPNQVESKNKEEEKKTLEDYFSVSTIAKCYVNRLDYEPILRA